MRPALHLRQICLAVPRLAPVLDDLQAILGLQVCHRDPQLAGFGLHNALLPIGEDFLELVAPQQADTAAGRFIQRSRGHGGYMAIFQTPNPLERQAAAQALGVRTAHEIDVPGYRSVQLHPRDCRAAFIELGHSLPDGPDSHDDTSRLGPWWPAGPQAAAQAAQAGGCRLRAVVLASPQPEDLARHWARILDRPLVTDQPQPGFDVDGTALRVVAGPAEVLDQLVLAVPEPAAVLARAVDRGLWVQADRFHLAGVHLQLVGAGAA